MPKGFFKEVGGRTRMRLVQPGYNADDYSTPLDKVVFDSEEIGTLSVIRAGEVYVGDGNGKNVKIVSWDLPYVPFCTFQYSRDGTSFYPFYESSGQDADDYDHYTRVTTTGVWVRYRVAAAPNSARLWMRYVAYRLAVF